MRNLKLEIEYHGGQFHGWQKQDGLRTVQGEIEQAFFTLTGENAAVEGSGRTDAGVHALCQVASVKIEKEIPVKNMKYALNNLLPKDVRVKKVEIASEGFHARFSAKRKTYQYLVQVGGDRSAIECDTVGFFSYQVDLKKMQQASKLLLGVHNFKGFCNAQTKVSNFEREIFDVQIRKKGKHFVFCLTGNGFLYNMVRIIVGTLLEVGCGRLSEEDIKKALDSGERKFAGKTMEAAGLYLKKVEYETDCK